MKQLGRIILIAIGFIALAAVLSSIPNRPAAASGGAPVNVLNTPLPVQGTVGVNNFPANQPVSGTVSVGNTPNVNVANTPTVNLAGGSSFNVSNPQDSQSNPAPLVTLEAAQPYEDTCNVSMRPGDVGGTCNFQTVPNGKRLVIQEVDAFLSIDSGLKPVALVLETPQPHNLTATFMASSVFQDSFATHQETHLYVGKNLTPKCAVGLNVALSTAFSSLNCQLSGYLVDAL